MKQQRADSFQVSDDLVVGPSHNVSPFVEIESFENVEPTIEITQCCNNTSLSTPQRMISDTIFPFLTQLTINIGTKM